MSQVMGTSISLTVASLAIIDDSSCCVISKESPVDNLATWKTYRYCWRFEFCLNNLHNKKIRHHKAKQNISWCVWTVLSYKRDPVCKWATAMIMLYRMKLFIHNASNTFVSSSYTNSNIRKIYSIQFTP